MQIYDIEFFTAEHIYEYEIKADSGAIYDKDIEAIKKDRKEKTLKEEKTSAGGSYIGIDRAKSIALERAGLSDSEVSFRKAKLEHDDGKTVYAVKFYKNGMEYECSVDAVSGKILEYEAERD